MSHINRAKMKKCIKYLFNIFSLLLAFCSSRMLWYWNVGRGWRKGYKGELTLALVGLMFCIVYWFFVKLYYANKIGLYRLTELVFFQILSFGIADAVLFVETIFWFHGMSRMEISYFLYVFVIQVFAITLAIFVCNRLYARFDEPRKLLVIYGSGDNSGNKEHAGADYRELLDKIHAKKYRYKVIGCIADYVPMEKIKEQIPLCDSLYLYEVEDKVQKELVMHCNKVGKNIYITQDIEEWIVRGFEVSHTFDTPFLRNKKSPESWYYPIVKRTFDIVFSGVGLLLASPLMLVIALCIKLYDHGPVVYKQVRLTKDHREFFIYKFRSMIVDAEKKGARLASKGDSRITPVGNILRLTHLDELPQLMNILKGDMSFVGPRPERPEIEKMYVEKLPEFSLRLNVKAGLTGYAQVFGKYNSTPEDKLKLDILYINQRSILLDIKLIFYTVKTMFIKESSEGVKPEDKTAIRDEDESVYETHNKSA